MRSLPLAQNQCQPARRSLAAIAILGFALGLGLLAGVVLASPSWASRTPPTTQMITTALFGSASRSPIPSVSSPGTIADDYVGTLARLGIAKLPTTAQPASAPALGSAS